MAKERELWGGFNPYERCVMTILNVTPDSFFEGSRACDIATIERRVAEAVEAGATIIDIGGYSSRPGAVDVDVEQEWERVQLGGQCVRRVAPNVVISIDTFRAEVARRAAEEFGQVVINDITAGEGDSDMWSVVAEYNLPYIAMHMRGTPQTMQSMTEYSEGVVRSVVDYFKSRVEQLQEAGVERIILDPGFGFAKSLEQNYELMAGLCELTVFGYPVLVGVSRKSMIYRLLKVDAERSLAGTIALGWEALRQGATILRVHDTREAVDTIRIYEKLLGR